jgi:hypothetical protein
MYNKLFRRENPLHGMAVLRTWLRMPILARHPLFRVKCLIPEPLALHPHHSPSSRQYSITMHTDNINMPDLLSGTVRSETTVLI